MIGNLYVISAPSGAGKTTLVKALIDSLPEITVSISHTTRHKRPAEVHGVNYYFISDDEFNDMVERNEFLEHATIFHNSYGTSRKWVEETLASNHDVILEIDWQGCQQIQRLFPECISIFILPPSFDALANRLTSRNQDKLEVIRERLTDAKDATSHINEYDFVVVNDHFETAVEDLRVIIKAGRLFAKRQIMQHSDLIDNLMDKLNISTQEYQTHK